MTEENKKICPIVKGECLGQQCEFAHLDPSESNSNIMCTFKICRNSLIYMTGQLGDIDYSLETLKTINKNLVKQSTKMPKSKEKKKTTKKSR